MPAWFLDSVTSTPGAIHVAGWALISHLPDALPAKVFVEAGSPLTVVDGFYTVANIGRPDVGAQYPSAGSAHGFNAISPEAPGTYQVCLNPIVQDPVYEQQTPL
jgi:hypothetical protein